MSAAYSTIRISDLSQYVGLGENEAGELAVSSGWTLDTNTGEYVSSDAYEVLAAVDKTAGRTSGVRLDPAGIEIICKLGS